MARRSASVEQKVARMKSRIEWYEKIGKLRLDIAAMNVKAKAAGIKGADLAWFEDLSNKLLAVVK
jgi:hypothetical protein